MCGDPPSVVRGVCLSPRVLHFGGDGADKLLRLVPTRVKAAIAATAINAAINAYSPWFNKSNLAQAAAKSL
jgi:hypothetical protein